MEEMAKSNSTFDLKIRDLVLELHKYGALKFGDFIMKVGVNSPVYFDLRVMVSYPQLMDNLSQLMWDYATSKNLSFDRLCGVPYTALPIATLMSVKSGIPMLMRRKEAKSYGTKKLIEGNFKKGDKCLIVEDVCTSGSSILETYQDLVKEELVASDCIIVVDRQQGGFKNLQKKGINVYSLTTLSEAMEILLAAGRIDVDVVQKVNAYTSANIIDLINGANCKSKTIEPVSEKRLSTPFSVRSQHSKCILATQLFKMMEQKKSNLCLAADVKSSAKLIELAQTLGPYIVIFKIHADIVKDFTDETAEKLKSIAKLHQFLIMEDRKFSDIGETVRQQYCSYSPWADLVTAHSLPGDGVLKALKTAFAETSEPRAVFVVAQLSCANNLIKTDYTQETVKMAESYSDIVAGYVCQTPDVLQSLGQIQLTPGVKFSTESDTLGQQYSSPDIVMHQKGADIAVVGRGVIEAKNIEETAKLYQKTLWTAYQNRISTC